MKHVKLNYEVTWTSSSEAYADPFALRDLVPFVQFKKREKHTWRSTNGTNVQIVQMVPNRAKHHKHFVEIVNGLHPLILFAKKFHLRCFTGICLWLLLQCLYCQLKSNLPILKQCTCVFVCFGLFIIDLKHTLTYPVGQYLFTIDNKKN